MSDPRLLAFVQEALRSGASRAGIERVLRDAGWPEARITAALAAFADSDFPVPVPRPAVTFSARDAFLYLILFGMLYVTAVNLARLVFQFIHLAFPDPLGDSAAFVYDRVRWATASLIVAFPLYLFVSYRVGRTVRDDPVRRQSGVRRWLTYLTLVAAALVLAGDAIVLIYNLLAGEMTLRFVLKAATTAGIAATVFGYYLAVMREDERELER